jgi:hypothetical protein
MRSIHVGHPLRNRIRVIFDDTVMSFSLSADTTFGEIAGLLGKLLDRRHGNPAVVDITLPRIFAPG